VGRIGSLEDSRADAHPGRSLPFQTALSRSLAERELQKSTGVCKDIIQEPLLNMHKYFCLNC
jgi:hypothetical protein